MSLDPWLRELMERDKARRGRKKPRYEPSPESDEDPDAMAGEDAKGHEQREQRPDARFTPPQELKAAGIDQLLMFDSLSDFVNYSLKNRDPKLHSTTNDDGFSGCSYNEAVRLARYGWPDGLSQLRSSIDKIHTLLQDEKPHKIQWDVEGCEPDIGRYTEGEPENMLEVTHTPRNPVMRILYCGSASCGVNSEQIMRRGAAMCALIDAIEDSGVRVELLWSHGFAPDCGNGVSEHRVQIKDADSSLPMERIAFVLGHVSMLRRLAFGVMEGMPAELRNRYRITAHGNYGHPLRRSSLTDHLNKTLGPVDLVIRPIEDYDQSFHEDEDMALWLKERIQEVKKLLG